MPKTKALTTTSFAILGLLRLRPWTAYELAQQMSRSLGYIWPRAASAIYEEPKNLVAHGLADVTVEPAGRRPRRVYRISAAGEGALAEWLRQPSAPPQFESEAVVRISFPEAGTVPDVLAAVAELRTQAEDLLARVGAQIDSYLAPDHGPFPARLHVIALDARFVDDYARFLLAWTHWAEAQVGRWPAMEPEDVSFALPAIAALAERRVSRGGGRAPGRSRPGPASRPR